MGIKFKESEAKRMDLPLKQDIVIDDKVVGTAEPSISLNTLRWHAVIHLGDALDIIGSGLAQGWGLTIQSAVADAIRQTRKQIEQTRESLAWIEQNAGTASLSDEQLSKLIKDVW